MKWAPEALQIGLSPYLKPLTQKTIARGNDGGRLSPGQDGTDHPPHVAPEM